MAGTEPSKVLARQAQPASGWRNSSSSVYPSLKSQGTHRPAQDGKTRTIKRSFAYSATQHRYTNIEKALDRSLAIRLWYRHVSANDQTPQQRRFHRGVLPTRRDALGPYPSGAPPPTSSTTLAAPTPWIAKHCCASTQSISRVCQGGIDIPPEVSSPGEAIDIARPTGCRPCGPGAVGGAGHWRGPAGLGAAWPRRAPHALALFTMVANRLAEPLSKLACYEYWMAERAYLPEAAALTLDHLYFALDFLDTHIEAIEARDLLSHCRSLRLMWTSSSGIRPGCTLRSMTKTPSA